MHVNTNGGSFRTRPLFVQAVRRGVQYVKTTIPWRLLIYSPGNFIWDPQTSFDTALESVRSVPDGTVMHAGDMRFERVELRSLSLCCQKQIQTRNGRHLNLCVETSPSIPLHVQCNENNN